jgi:ribonuclease HI
MHSTQPQPGTPAFPFLVKADEQPGKLFATVDREQPDAGAFVAHADGSALGNPGPGGWACLIQWKDGSRIVKAGGCAYTTNNRAELQGAIEALMELPTSAVGELRLDSEYVVKAVNEWRRDWERRGFRTSSNKPVKNADLFRVLFALVDERPGVRLTWVRGHSGEPGNELVDSLARAEALKAKEGVQ